MILGTSVPSAYPATSGKPTSGLRGGAEAEVTSPNHKRELYLTNDGDVRAERAVACRQSARPHGAPKELVAPADDSRGARGILLAVLLGTAIWASIGAAADFIFAL